MVDFKYSFFYSLLIIHLASFFNLSIALIDITQEKVIICGVGKNIARFIPNMSKKIEQLGRSFKNYRVIIYENNSTDQTVNLLNNWKNNNQNVIIISESLNADQLYKRTIGHALRDKAPCRMELIAFARNEVLKIAMREEYQDYKYLIMTDLDFSRGWEIQGVLSSFNVPIEWDCVTANSVTNNNYEYYDRYAYRDEQFPLGPELIGEEFWHLLGPNPIRLYPKSNLYKVYSAFGGIAIYKKETLKNCSYSGYITEDLEKLMNILINTKISKNNKHYQIYKKTLNADSQDHLPILFQANCGYDSPVVCEHSTLHASMLLHGFDKIYINPQMICYY